ncbi:MAG: DUF3021 domain-containing protein [Lachnospiraceae bacterium]|nr:DUF3021 domain-containing protein [Lachnospiraceae bacterium]
MSIKDRFVYKAAIGFSLGVLVTIIINILVDSIMLGNAGAYIDEFASNDVGRTVPRLLLELLTGGLLGLVGNGGSVVYEIEAWGILKPTTIHFGVTMLVYVFVGLFNGWLTPYHSIQNIIQFLAMLFAYIMIWLLQYLVFRREVRQINRDIKLFKEKEETIDEM